MTHKKISKQIQKPQPSFIEKTLLVFVFAFLIYLRFFKSVEWFSFNFDEEYQALLAWSQVKDFHPIWIGVSASNFGFYLGPAFTYLNALLFWVGKGDLSVLAYFSSFFGIITTLSLYYVVSKVFSHKAGTISALLYGFSSLLIYFDHRFWNPTPIPFVTIWLFYSLYCSYKDSRFFILTSVLMASALHIHLSLMVYWPLVISIVFKNIRKISLSTWIISIFSYLLVVSPLIVFDITHNFDDLLGPIRYLTSPKTSGSVLGTSQLLYHFQYVWNSVSRILYLRPFTNIQEEHGLGVHAEMTPPIFILSLFVVTVLFWFVYETIKKQEYRILLGMMVSILLFYLIYPSIGCEYYLLGFFTMVMIVLGLFLVQFKWAYLFPFLAIYIFVNSKTIFTTTQSQYGLLARRTLINQVMSKIGNTPFKLETYGISPLPYHPYGGWRYLFQTYGLKPASSFADEYFGWIYRDELVDENPIYRVAISEVIPYTSDATPEAEFSSGAYKAYVFKIK